MKKVKRFYYLNFEDQRLLNFEVGDFEKLDEVFHELYGDSKFYFFDEMQNIPKWEVFVRKMQDLGKKFVITGSNASMLSKELGTKLTGRHISKQLYPFSYKEMLALNKEKASISSFEKYFSLGGFPDYLQYQETQYLQEIFRDILTRDIIIRHKLREIRAVQELAVYLLSNVGKEISYNKLKEQFRLGSTNSIISFVSYFEDSYLLFTIPKFDYSPRKQLVNPKKVYAIDIGLARANSISFSEDKGRILENIAFLQLKRKNKDVYYFREKNECDFLVREKGKIVQALQVCYKVKDDNKEREISGLIEAMEKFNLKKGLILTYDQEDRLDVGNKEIMIKPVWRWLLE